MTLDPETEARLDALARNPAPLSPRKRAQLERTLQGILARLDDEREAS